MTEEKKFDPNKGIDPNKFDLRTHIVDPSTGQVVKVQPYKLRISRDEGSLFERPIGSGYWFYENGVLAKKPSKDAPDSPPIDHQASSSPMEEIMRLRAELAAMKQANLTNETQAQEHVDAPAEATEAEQEKAKKPSRSPYARQTA